MFFSGDGRPTSGGLKMIGRLSLLSEEDLWAMKGLPNEIFPSDHLSLLARFQLELTPVWRWRVWTGRSSLTQKSEDFPISVQMILVLTWALIKNMDDFNCFLRLTGEARSSSNHVCLLAEEKLTSPKFQTGWEVNWLFLLKSAKKKVHVKFSLVKGSFIW